MAAPTRPASTKTFQAENWKFVPTIASLAAPTAVEANAAGSLDVSCYLFADSAVPSQNTNRVQLARRLCDGGQYEQIGTTTYAGGDMKYAYNPQGATGSAGKKVYETFPSGTVGYLVHRLGVSVTSDFAAGQFVDVYPVAFGPAMPMSSSQGEDAEGSAMQGFAITGPPSFNVALV